MTKPLDRGIVEAGLDPGESQVLSLALELDVFTVFLDELGARRVATELGLPVIGVIGVVLRAKEAGIIQSVQPRLQRLIDFGFYVSTRLITYALEESGEAVT